MSTPAKARQRMFAEVSEEVAKQMPAESGEKKGPTRLIGAGYPFGEVASAMQKEIRRSDTDAALYWALQLYQASAAYAWKRVLITAAEDVGMGDPQAVQEVISLGMAWRICSEQGYSVDPQHIVMAVMTLCQAEKSTMVDDAKNVTLETIAAAKKDPSKRRPMPEYAQDVHTAAGKAMGKTERDWYRDRHDLFGVPVNRYTRRLAKLIPKSFVGVKALESQKTLIEE